MCSWGKLVKPGTHWRQSWMSKRLSTEINTGDKSATKSTVADTFDFVTGFDDCLPSVHTGDKAEFDSLSRSTLSPKLNMFNSVDFVESGWFLSPECRTSFRLCRQCVPGFKWKRVSTNSPDYINWFTSVQFTSSRRDKVCMSRDINKTQSQC